MAKYNIYISSLLFIFFCGALNAKDVRLSSIDYPPFYGKNLENNGPLIELISESFKNSGYQTKIIFAPWKRGMIMAEEGKESDGVVGAWHSNERENNFIYSDPIFPNRLGFFKHKNNDVKFKSYADLVKSEYTLGTVRGYIMPSGLEESGIRIELVRSDIQNFKKLATRRIDLVVVDQAYAQYVLKNIPDVESKIEWMEPALEEKQQYLIISRKAINAQQKIDDFNQGLKILRQTGKFSNIMEKHGLVK
ncbi:putative amino acid ABC transporter, periplasmic component [Oleiphilus messinensis]|uniref:Putative amino acid ABC transporter, periplasmic component n=1 Tax=Oleiphilus messinensis TaxID=141451 RepID=A0A1Y0I8P6_9GAMM|nr:transporter substrate-binding domain-containing protein [Oleiphilus messinensis]ARU56831.1 putative amino acid ABC transporter, periplasmic component [Oleiphilus messinensis]